MLRQGPLHGGSMKHPKREWEMSLEEESQRRYSIGNLVRVQRRARSPWHTAVVICLQRHPCLWPLQLCKGSFEACNPQALD